MNRTIFGAMVVVLSACMAGMNGARAEDTTEQDNHTSQPGCSQSNRVTHSQATCLEATWDNTTGNFSAENTCQTYGSIVAHVEMEPEVQHLHLQAKSSGRSTFTIRWTVPPDESIDPQVEFSRKSNFYSSGPDEAVSDVSCCTDNSDLCYRQEVEANADGVIKRHTSGTSYVDASVATHDERWLFCQDYPDAIYCEVDPEGDAKTAPPAFPDPNLQDCYDNWAASPAASSCTDFRTETSGRLRAESVAERMRLALSDSACHDSFALCDGEGFHIGKVERDGNTVHDPVPVADMTTAQWCGSVSYRRCVWNAHTNAYDAEELTTRGDGMLGGTCPGSFTVWGSDVWYATKGPFDSRVEDGTHDCDLPPESEPEPE